VISLLIYFVITAGVNIMFIIVTSDHSFTIKIDDLLIMSPA